MKTVGKRRESAMMALATGELLAEDARFNESIVHLAKTTFVPKGVYRYRSHEAANRHQQDCLVHGMGQLATERAQDERQVDIWRRADGGSGRLQTLVAGKVLQLDILDASVSLDEAYENVEFMENMAVAPVGSESAAIE